MKKLVVIGGGPSGMMAAISAKIHHPEIDCILLERNSFLGKKMKLTGGGRCNVTANQTIEELIDHIPKNGRFLYSALTEFNAQDIISFFESHGCKLKEEDHHRMFPKSNLSEDIVKTLAQKLIALGVKLKMEHQVIAIDSKQKTIQTSQGSLSYDFLIIATGGKTLPQSGSDGSGYLFAEHIGHHITELIPAEVPLVSNDAVIQSKVLQGLSFKDVMIHIKTLKNIKTLKHDLLFTHFGISGPLALRASFYVINVLKTEPVCPVSIDFLPMTKIQALEQMAEKEVMEICKSSMVPKRLLDYLKEIDPLDQKWYLRLKSFELNIHGYKGFSQAFVTNGGIETKEIDPKTMRSKLDESISFCGEIIDYNAYTGGYNITSALATGYHAGAHFKGE